MQINTAAHLMTHAPAGQRAGVHRYASAAEHPRAGAPDAGVSGQATAGNADQGPSRSGEDETARTERSGSAAEQRRAALEDPNSPEASEVRELARTDREVRAHEMAHLAAAAGNARGGPVYEFRVGPDGKRYAVGGHVNIDTSAVAGNPAATLRKAQAIQRAALAPAEPSAQDRSVAARATAMASEARVELAEQRRAQTGAGGRDGTPGPDAAAAGRAEPDGDGSVRSEQTGAAGERAASSLAATRLQALAAAAARPPAARVIDTYA